MFIGCRELLCVRVSKFFWNGSLIGKFIKVVSNLGNYVWVVYNGYINSIFFICSFFIFCSIFVIWLKGEKIYGLIILFYDKENVLNLIVFGFGN